MSRQRLTPPKGALPPGSTAEPPTINLRAEVRQPEGSPVVEPLVVKPKVAGRMISKGLTGVYELITAGELVSYTDGRSRLITTESIRAYVARKLAAGGRP